MGLLDMLQSDPNKQQALRQGLLNAGIQMLAGGPQDFGTSLGQGLGAGVKSYQDKLKAYNDSLARQNMVKAATKPAVPAIPAKYSIGGTTGNADYANMAADQNKAINSMATPYDAPLPEQPVQTQAEQPGQPASFDFGAMAQHIMASPDAPPELQKLAMDYYAKQQEPKAPEAYSLSPGQVRFSADGKQIAAVPANPTQNASAIGKLIAERDALPPGDPNRALYDEAIQKNATHAPAAQMNNYGSPVAGLGPDGKPVFFQPSKGGGAPSIVPGVTPMADLKIQAQKNKDETALSSSFNSMDRLAAAANEVLHSPGLAGVYGIRGAIPNIPGSEAANAAALLNTLKSQVGFSVLQEMRNNSKTGGALGQVTDMENKLLQENLAALEKSQSVEQAKASLQKIIDYTSAAKDRMSGAYNRQWSGQNDQIPSVQPTQSESDFIKSRRAAGMSDAQIAAEMTQNAKPKTVKELPKKPPAGVDAKLWQYMTPEERKLWQK
ncbi:MAG: hypothetical protein ACYCZJ_13175 [Sulfuriferula sp.]